MLDWDWTLTFSDDQTQHSSIAIKLIKPTAEQAIVSS